MVEISQDALTELKGYRQDNGDELAGVLVGSVISNNHVRIDRVSPPCVENTQRFQCVRSAEKTNDYVLQEYESSEHTRVYLGEWHTHPESNPMPSTTDVKSARENLCNNNVAVNFLILIIVGSKTIYFAVVRDLEVIVVTPIIVG